MINDFSPKILDLNTIDEARQAMQDIHCTDAGIKIMQDKALFKVIKLYDVNSKPANILKQTFLSKGGEVAISRHCADLSKETSDVIIMATIHQYKRAIPVLKMQPWKLKQIAEILITMIKEV